ncbi:MAG: uroporphyrinogen decarboxylase family protein [Acetivibrionales bacterium]
MTNKERILRTVRGEPCDRIPYIPRLDIWYNANKFRGTLPDKYKKATLKEIVEDLDLGYHYVIPDYKNYEGEDGDIDVGIGLYRFDTQPYSFTFHNVEREIERSSDGHVHVVYKTPKGNLSTSFSYNEDMRKMGLTLSVVTEHAIKNEDDLEAVAYIFENAEVQPKYDKYLEFKENVVGDNGICTGYSLVWVCPMHYISKDLMAFDAFFYAMADYPEKMEWLSDKLMPFFRKVFDITASSPAEVILSGANYDVGITPPNFFRDYITPELKKQSDALHKLNKYLITHTDGENKGLLEEYVKSGFDIADSICPAPMTSQSLKEVRDVLKDKITIWGGIPSAALLESSMSDKEFESFLDNTMQQIGDGKKMIFAIADTTPPDAKFERILRIAQKVKEFGRVK